MLEDCGGDDDQEEAIVPLPNVNSEILRRILQWAEYHKNDDDAVPNDEADKEKNEREKRNGGGAGIPPWDVEFLKVDQDTLFDIILAANYLDVKVLMDAACKTVANMIKGKSPEEMRKTFQMINDFDQDEEDLHGEKQEQREVKKAKLNDE